jgi:hypothetical protein
MMGMPRFSIRFLLVGIAVVALWLSTIANYKAAYDFQALIRLCILVASGAAAVSYDGRRRTFWAGFFITVWTVGIDRKLNIGQFWITPLLNSYGLSQTSWSEDTRLRFMFLDSTLQAVVMLLVATVMGSISILVYDLSQQNKTE